MSEALALRTKTTGRDGTAELVRRARTGDVDSFDLLIRQHQRTVMRLAYQMVGNMADAQDVSQDVFIRLWKYLDRIRDEARFSTWLYRMVVNSSYDLLNRRRSSRDSLSLDDRPVGMPEPMDRVTVPADEEAAASQLKRRLLGSLDRLTPSERTVFVLRDIDGLDVREIAAIHESSQVTVRRHLSSARQKMRAMLAELYPGLAGKGGDTP